MEAKRLAGSDFDSAAVPRREPAGCLEGSEAADKKKERRFGQVVPHLAPPTACALLPATPAL